MKNHSRKITSLEDAEIFLKDIVELECNSDSLTHYSQMFFECEQVFTKAYFRQTYDCYDYRDHKYLSQDARDLMAKRIYSDLLSYCIADYNQPVISRPEGGLPKSYKVTAERNAFYIIGLPTAGKTLLASYIADLYNAFTLDIDIVKRKLPEYKNIYGACVTHKESSYIMNGSGTHSVLNHCIDNGWNIILPKIGNIESAIINTTQLLLSKDYKVHLILAEIDRKIAVKRTFTRFLSTGRYISLPLIFDLYGNEPNLNYYKLKNKKLYFSSYEIINCENLPFIADITENSPIQEISPIISILYKGGLT